MFSWTAVHRCGVNAAWSACLGSVTSRKKQTDEKTALPGPLSGFIGMLWMYSYESYKPSLSIIHAMCVAYKGWDVHSFGWPWCPCQPVPMTLTENGLRYYKHRVPKMQGLGSWSGLGQGLVRVSRTRWGEACNSGARCSLRGCQNRSMSYSFNSAHNFKVSWLVALPNSLIATQQFCGGWLPVMGVLEKPWLAFDSTGFLVLLTCVLSVFNGSYYFDKLRFGSSYLLCLHMFACSTFSAWNSSVVCKTLAPLWHTPKHNEVAHLEMPRSKGRPQDQPDLALDCSTQCLALRQ